ncbi:hypothetical protein PFMALIP_00714 [Plasmodium falciparum MaliPS096_E11]|nr:hypothetical protein PFMALIP_00714 [Plasmodium falciparum MaliPS096_E11]
MNKNLIYYGKNSNLLNNNTNHTNIQEDINHNDVEGKKEKHSFNLLPHNICHIDKKVDENNGHIISHEQSYNMISQKNVYNNLYHVNTNNEKQKKVIINDQGDNTNIYTSNEYTEANKKRILFVKEINEIKKIIQKETMNSNANNIYFNNNNNINNNNINNNNVYNSHVENIINMKPLIYYGKEKILHKGKFKKYYTTPPIPDNNNLYEIRMVQKSNTDTYADNIK